jgi:hypothetical protein
MKPNEMPCGLGQPSDRYHILHDGTVCENSTLGDIPRDPTPLVAAFDFRGNRQIPLRVNRSVFFAFTWSRR